MTIQQLMDAVANLGFETALGDVDTVSPTVFFPALNKAVYKVNEIRPKMASVSFVHAPLKPISMQETIVHTDGDKYVSAANIVSFSFRVKGACKFAVLAKDHNGNSIQNADISITCNGDELAGTYDGIYTVNSANTENIIRCYIGKKDGGNVNLTITFTGEFVYIVSSFCCFESAYSSDANDVPIYDTFVSYDMKKLAADFMSFQHGYVENVNGIKLQNALDYVIKNDSILRLPWNENRYQYLTATYSRKLWQYDLDGARDEFGTQINTGVNTEIDLDGDIASMLPNLVAFYVLQDDEPAKAQNYYQIFLSEYNEKRSLERSVSPASYDMRNTWG